MTRQGWQPIETAPKDGTRILVWAGYVEIVTWSDEAEFKKFRQSPGWQVYACEDGYYSRSLELSEPTYWMPLPSAPKEQR